LAEFLVSEATFRGVVVQAIMNDEVVGVAALNTETGEISPILVDSGHRREGIATGLVDILEDAGRRAGLRSIYASVPVDNQPSRELWCNLGYGEWMKYETWLGEDDDPTNS